MIAGRCFINLLCRSTTIFEIRRKAVKEGFKIIQMDAIKGQKLNLWVEEGKTRNIL